MFPTLLKKLPRAKSRDFSRLLTSFSAEQQNIVSEALQGQKVNIEGRLKGITTGCFFYFSHFFGIFEIGRTFFYSMY